ncbi:hypothetical protein DHD32_12545 [Arenibacter sp. TNZ]|uniref:hypothetical protein n=1 Tax=Arenibacter TaxID=178469 RepID=UPI000CD47C13|nr:MULTISPECIES: hypothetical protein [Arenibacter]MCM4172315.1 hypothetical protein [Arenibacter sp. TNZ]
MKAHNKLAIPRIDTICVENIPCHQGLPAVYPVSVLKNVYPYLGSSPYITDILDNLGIEQLEEGVWANIKTVTPGDIG